VLTQMLRNLNVGACTFRHVEDLAWEENNINLAE